MFESFGRGFKMIGASIKMGWQDRRLLVPSVLTVFTNIFFGLLLLFVAAQDMSGGKAVSAMENMAHLGGQPGQPHRTHGLLPGSQGGSHGLGLLHSGNSGAGHGLLSGQGSSVPGAAEMLGLAGVNQPFDQSGWAAIGGSISENAAVLALILIVWWTTNRFFEGITTAMVYSHLTEGRGSGRFSKCMQAVLASLPAILMLGLVTLIFKRLAGWLRHQKNAGGLFGFGFRFLASIVEIFWTLAGHLILPAIVIEGTSFWGGLKRADKIASGNLLTIGVGEVGVDLICRMTTMLVYMAGVAGFGAAWYLNVPLTSPLLWTAGLAWAGLVVAITALSIYIRAAFYTCLYVWAIDAEAVRLTERKRVRAPEPLAAALA